MACVDTNVLLDLLGRGGRQAHLRARRRMDELEATGEDLVTTRLNLAELYVGVHLAAAPERELAAISDLSADFDVLEFDDGAARAFGRIQAYLRRRGTPIGDMDTLIAAIAMANGHGLVTSNTRHFAAIPGLTLVGY